MPGHIRGHSEQVARFAVDLARRAATATGFGPDPEEVRACALLHDIAKHYTILYGGSHAQLGAAWVVAETGHAGIAQGVLYHVHWPWPLEEEEICSLPFPVMYADKRTLHAGYVTIPERYEDLLVRYGVTEKARRAILTSRRQALLIESALSAKLGMQLDAYTPDSGRLVP
jgi:putative nucleotidyltransferase with HDIG domain